MLRPTAVGTCCRMLHFIFMFLISTAHAAPVESPLREGLGFPPSTAAAFDDEDILSSIRQALESADFAPVWRINIEGGSESLTIQVVGRDRFDSFLFKKEQGRLVITNGPLKEKLLHQVEVPFGNLHARGFQQKELTAHTPLGVWLAVGVVGIYAAKKLLNKMTLGSFSSAGHAAEEPLFPTAAMMRGERVENRAILERALDAQLDDFVFPLAEAASCPESQASPVCDPAEVRAARGALMRSFPSFALRFGKDFYEELIAPVVGLAAAAKDFETRRQIWNYFDLIFRRMIQERGVAAALMTGVFVGTGQLVVETLESFVMPAGMHMFCQVGNAAVLAAAAKAYSAYFCLTRHQEFKGKSFAERWRNARVLARLSKRDAPLKEDHEKVIHALNLLFRLVERDVRHGRNLEELGAKESRELARRLGDLRRQLTLISIRLIQNNSAGNEARDWLKLLYEVQTQADPSRTGCGESLEPAA